MTIASHVAGGRRAGPASSSASSSRTMPRSIDVAPGLGEQRGEHRARCSRGSARARSGEPSSTSSSPVDSTATVARGWTVTVRALTLASTAGDGRADHGAGREQQVAGLDVVAGGAHRRARLARPRDSRTRSAVEPLAVLDHHDRVGAGRHRRAGHDPDRLARRRRRGRCWPRPRPRRRRPARPARRRRRRRAPRSRRRRCWRTAGRPRRRRRRRRGPARWRCVERHLDRGERRAGLEHQRLGVLESASRPAPYRRLDRQTGTLDAWRSHTAFPADGYTARWQTWDDEHIETLTLRWENEGWTASGEVGRERIHYVIRLSPTWQVRQFLLFRDLDEPDLWLATDGHARWGEMNGAHRPELDGCHDIDLACTPFTQHAADPPAAAPRRRQRRAAGRHRRRRDARRRLDRQALPPRRRAPAGGCRTGRAAPRSTSASTSTASSSTSPTASAAAETPGSHRSSVCFRLQRGWFHADRSARKSLRAGPMSGSARVISIAAFRNPSGVPVS